MNLSFSNLLTRYDVTGEIMMLALNAVLLLIMLVTKPKTSRMYTTCIAGTHLALFTTILHFFLLMISSSWGTPNLKLFNTVYFIFDFLYITILNVIYAYISMLSYIERSHIKRIVISVLSVAVLYLVITLYPLFTGKLYVVASDGSLFFTSKISNLEICGILCAVFSMIRTFLTRRSVSRIVFWGIMIFCPIEIAVLVVNCFFKYSFFLSFTYIIPFLIFYILFHSSVFDDIVGCQHTDGLESIVDKAIAHHKKYVVINVYIPQLKMREFSDIQNIVQDVATEKIRKVERIVSHSRIYTSNIYSYELYGTYKNPDEPKKIAEAIRSIIAEPFEFRGRKYSIASKEIIITDNIHITSSGLAKGMVGYLSQFIHDDMESECLVPEEKDYENFVIYHKIEQTVLDIRAKGKLDDDRILCYIQPIHCTATNSFRTGEALLRLQIDGKIVQPYYVINAAESNNCIHAITLIMINKVCHKIKELEDQNYDFDAITVNCSTIELADEEFHKELLKIVHDSGIEPGHLRVEITESTSISNYKNILLNMKELNSAGISFYLDDFGTGYSNLERISSYPFKTIKFDKSILYSAIEENSYNRLVRLLVRYFHENNFHTVVEGVEDEMQFNFCRSIGFEYIQGFLFAKPIPADEITDYFVKKE